MSQIATITPNYIDDPKPGKTNYSVKDANGARWSVPPAEAQKMVKGQPCVVEYEISNFNNRTFNMVKRVDATQGPAPAPQPAVATYQQFAPVGAGAPPVAHVDDKEEGMFVMGVVGRSMGSGSFSVSDIPALTNMAVWAWRNRQAINDAEME